MNGGRRSIGDCILTTGCNAPRSCANAGECGSARVRAFLGAPPPVVPSPPALGPNLPNPLRKNAGPDATPTPVAQPIICPECHETYPNHLGSCSRGTRPLPFALRHGGQDNTAPPFALLRAQADLLLALYLLEHPKARPSQLSAVELIGWAATKV
jgi:hypothetical protein